MSLRPTSSPLHLHFFLVRPQNPNFLSRSLEFPEFRYHRRRRRRLKVSFSFHNFFNDLISNFPSSTSLDLIAPALGLASGAAALYFSRDRRFRKISDARQDGADIGNWILVTSPTPFNRFVLLRCPSISFVNDDAQLHLLEGINDRLVKEERHFVNWNRGRIFLPGPGPGPVGSNTGLEDELVYQRVCISAGDGGMISLDWPANLDLAKEHGLDTTVLIVPGTAEGSMDSNIRSLVGEVLVRGCFPVVMNPRGCAGSPLTTARLFTAADSDDICTAIQFINKSRPWATLMSISWGYGANMLTKYLGEVGERTPLTAAVCVDNPFDLEEATRSFPHHIAMDQKLTGGLIDILRTNKELFQGRMKGFNVADGLSATSVRDFDKAISMVSYGFEAIEDFYSKSSTRESVGCLRVPVLFIQSHDGTVPPFSIPRGSIAENPFTSLLLCSCLPSSTASRERSAIPWCRHLAIEWLSAVELALLKGRHPLLKDVDISISPSKGLTLSEGSELGGKVSSEKGILGHQNLARSFLTSNNENKDHFVNRTHSDGFHAARAGGALDVSEVEVQDRADSRFQSIEKIQGKSLGSTEPNQENSNVVLQQSSSVNSDSVNDGGDTPLDNEISQAIHAAEFVMNMLDATAPGTLAEEQKKKVLAAMEQGETFVKSLQGAVPEDVRGKLTASFSDIVRTQGVNLNFDGLKTTIKDKIKGLSSASGGYSHSLDDIKMGVGSESKSSQGGISHDSKAKAKDDSSQLSSGDELRNDTGTSQTDVEKSSIKLSAEVQSSMKSQESANLGPPSENSQGGHVIPESKDSCETEHAMEASQSKANQSSANVESGSAEKTSGVEEAVGDRHKMNQNKSNDDQMTTKEVTGEEMESSTDKSKPFSYTEPEESSSSVLTSPESSQMEKEGTDTHEHEDKNVQATRQESVAKAEEQKPGSSSGSPSINVTQALDALTGIDDSTQMAVNSVFGVIENMINQLEKENNQGNDGMQDENEDRGSGMEKGSPITGDTDSEKEDGENQISKPPDKMQLKDHLVNWSYQDAKKKFSDEKLTEISNLSLISRTDSLMGDNVDVGNMNVENNSLSQKVMDPAHFMENMDKIKHVRSIPLHISINPYGDSVYKEYLRKCLHSKVPNTKPLDLDSTSDLFLEYFPEEGEWKLLGQLGNTRESMHGVESCKDINRESQNNLPSVNSDMEKIIEPSYVILDSEPEYQSAEGNEVVDDWDKRDDLGYAKTEYFVLLVKKIVLDALKVEVSRRLGMPDVKALDTSIMYDLEQIADSVGMAVIRDKDLNHTLESKGPIKMNSDTIQGEHIIQAILSALVDANHLRNVLPVGVVVGSSLAALRKYFPVAALDDAVQSQPMQYQAGNVGHIHDGYKTKSENDHYILSAEKDPDSQLNHSLDNGVGEHEVTMSNNNKVMVGAVTAALSASALLACQKGKELYNYQNTEVPFGDAPMKDEPQKEHSKVEADQERNQNNIVTSLAEKAMSVAAPVVPTRSDGEVDQERLVAILADLGQKGGILRLIGKVALLWGGIRGAMSLIDRLISFLRLEERPLFQRILGFFFMVLVLWSPVVVPLIPTLVQNWVVKSSTGIAEYACIIGLYTAVNVLVMLWGKRIRGYENPLKQYGLDSASPTKKYDFLKGLMGGIMLVLSIHSMNALLGCGQLAWPSDLPSSPGETIIWFKMLGKMLVLAARGIVPATGVAVVEELLFRSWLPEEIAVDLGYHRAIIISGLAFSLLQRSLTAIPGLWFLSLALAGAKQRSGSNLFAPIGMRAGVITANFILQTGGFLIYNANASFWVTGIHPWQPFGGIIGLTFCVMLAILLYPQQSHQRKMPG